MGYLLYKNTKFLTISALSKPRAFPDDKINVMGSNRGTLNLMIEFDATLRAKVIIHGGP